MFQIDADLSSLDTGVWEEFKGSKFLIAHISNSNFQRALTRYQQPYRRKIADGTIDPEKNKEILAKALSEAILLDWTDVIDKSGQPVKYTKALAFSAIMRDPEFRDFVSEFAMAMSNFRSSEIDDLGKS